MEFVGIGEDNLPRESHDLHHGNGRGVERIVQQDAR
jgi:hypothetical protein